MKPILYFFILNSFMLLGQISSPNYNNLIKQADSLYKIKEFKKSAAYYQKAFSVEGGYVLSKDRYNAASCLTKINNIDSAFYHLNMIATYNNYSNYNFITTDQALDSLHKDTRWDELIAKVKMNLTKIEEKYNLPLMALIDSIKSEDKKWRNLQRQYLNGGLDTTTFTISFILKKIHEIDNSNYSVCKNILEKYNYPNYELVGVESSNNYWLVIQHLNQHVLFQDSVLKKMKVEVDKGLASSINYAYLTDEVKISTNQLQIYGTQMVLNKSKTTYEPKPVIDPTKLNERRKSVGLNSIEEFIKTTNKINRFTLKK